MRRSLKVSGGVAATYAVLGVLVAGLSFASPALAAPEAPTTDAATAVKGTSATLNGTLNPGAETGKVGYFFTYNAGASCEGGPSTEPGEEKEGKAVKVSTPVASLEAKTEYTFCAVATHEGESTAGGPLSFTTMSSAPVVEGGGMTGNTPFSASLSAAVNPENESTSCVFEYGETSLLGNTVGCEQGTLEGGGPEGVSVNIGELKPGTTYHYRVVAKNATGKTEGSEGEFSTQALEAPKFENLAVSNLTSESVKLEVQINPNYQPTHYSFEYATNESFTGATVVAGTETLEGFGGIPVSTTLSGLKPRTHYFFRVVAKNGSGPETVSGEFETLGKPIVTTGSAEPEQITRTTANVSGTVNPGGAKTLAYVAYIDQADYEAAGGAHVEDPYAGEGGHVTSSVEISAETEGFASHPTGVLELRELKAGTTYHYAVVATNSEGTTIGPDATLTTSPATPPVVTTGEAVGVTQTSATLTGSVDTRGLRTTMSFEMGDTPALGLPEQASVVSESGTTVGIELPFANYLPSGTTFYYRACASNADGTNCGAVKTFTTATFAMPPTYTAPSIPLLPVKSVPPPAKPKKQQKKKSGSSGKLGKALKACAKKPRSERAACQRQARKKHGKKG